MSVEVIKTNDDIFDIDAEVYLNPVNTKGIMGRGLAKTFKDRCPLMYQYYRKACLNYDFQMGRLNIYKVAATQGLKCRYIVNFPTKTHWRLPSTYEYLSVGFVALLQFIEQNKISSIAIPPLGCGCGGLDTTKVLNMIDEEFIKKVDSSLTTCYLTRFQSEDTNSLYNLDDLTTDVFIAC